MKPRKVLVTLELLTDANVTKLRDKFKWTNAMNSWAFREAFTVCEQVQVNVIKPTKTKKK